MQSIDENQPVDNHPLDRPEDALSCHPFRNPYRTARLLCNAGVAVALAVGAVFLTLLPSTQDKPHITLGEYQFYLDGRVSKVCTWDWAGFTYGHCINWTDDFARKHMGICKREVVNTSRCSETLLMESVSQKNAPLSVTGLWSDGSFHILYPSAQSAALQLSPANNYEDFPQGCEIIKKMRFLGVEHISVIAPGITDDNVPVMSSNLFRLGNLAFQKPEQFGPTNYSEPLTNSSWVYADFDWVEPATAKCSWERSSFINAELPFPWPPGPAIAKVYVDVTFKRGWNFLRSTMSTANESSSTGPFGAALHIETTQEPTDHEWIFNYLPSRLPTPGTNTTTSTTTKSSTKHNLVARTRMSQI